MCRALAGVRVLESIEIINNQNNGGKARARKSQLYFIGWESSNREASEIFIDHQNKKEVDIFRG